MRKRLFISSVQKEFAEERRLLCRYIREDALLCKFFEPFLFEELPAINLSAQDAYLTEAKSCDVYLGIYGKDYGFEESVFRQDGCFGVVIKRKDVAQNVALNVAQKTQQNQGETVNVGQKMSVKNVGQNIKL